MCEDKGASMSGASAGFLEEFGEKMEIPPSPIVACGMVRRARGVKKGNKGGGKR
jgi:hypothetical protein